MPVLVGRCAIVYPCVRVEFSLLVASHGGPTSAATSTFNALIQYWTSRGFAYVDVNYGGSTGYGRAYRQRLQGMWGVTDMNDCVAAADFLVREGRVDARKLCIRGGSAGGTLGGGLSVVGAGWR